MINNDFQFLSSIAAKEAVFSLFLEFKSICEKNNFTYWLGFGTLLGAIRHNDFIPWDDDFDVFMPRNDYESFLALFKNVGFGPDLNVLHYRFTKKYPYVIARFNDTRYVTYEQKVSIHYGLGVSIDIYPLDGFYIEDKKSHDKLCRSLTLIDFSNKKVPNLRDNFIKNLPKVVFWLFLKLIPKKLLLRRTDFLARKVKFGQTDYCGDICWDPRFKFSYDWFSDTVYVRFHGIECPVPLGYDKLLQCIYGEYMKLPPEQERVPNHFTNVVRIR